MGNGEANSGESIVPRTTLTTVGAQAGRLCRSVLSRLPHPTAPVRSAQRPLRHSRRRQSPPPLTASANRLGHHRAAPTRQAAFFTYESEINGQPVPDGQPVPAVTKVWAKLCARCRCLLEAIAPPSPIAQSKLSPFSAASAAASPPTTAASRSAFSTGCYTGGCVCVRTPVLCPFLPLATCRCACRSTALARPRAWRAACTRPST